MKYYFENLTKSPYLFGCDTHRKAVMLMVNEKTHLL